ncbi:hypothetical protein [Shewanella halifaxensis]|nr:hypothetical protein [Shewanella halifaxensis]
MTTEHEYRAENYSSSKSVAVTKTVTKLRLELLQSKEQLNDN